MIEAVQTVRAWRDLAEVRAAATLPARLAAEGYEDTEAHLARLARLSFSTDGAAPAASVPIPGGVVELLPSPDLDLEAAERKRAKRRLELEEEIASRERKLANSAFVEKAPPEVVQKVRDELERLRAEQEAM